MDKINVELLDKHRNYISKYQPNDLYWGIGIENETYLRMKNDKEIDPKTYYEKFAKRERYSIDYFNSSYNLPYKELIKKQELPNKMPVLLNSHTFLKTDINNEHLTTYTKNPSPNPKFNGKTIYEFICEKDSYFIDEYMKSFIFDGDTIEFITTNFYKTNIYDVINELKNNKKIFIEKLKKIFQENKIFESYGEVEICKENLPFASFMTNINNYSIFNNMTYHINITLPTKLNTKCFIQDYDLFKRQHTNAIHVIQWIEPILIANYGSGDIFYETNKNLTNCSQRCAKSRFIGLGTYDTEKLEPGKILQIESENNHLSDYSNWWYKKYYEKCSYKKEEKIGVDINFHKHKNHGIEIRIFDYFEEDKLEKVLIFLVLLMDYSLENLVTSPVKNDIWNNLVINILFDKNHKFNVEEKIQLSRIFKLNIDFEDSFDFYDKLYNYLMEKYENKGECYTKMVKPSDIVIKEELNEISKIKDNKNDIVDIKDIKDIIIANIFNIKNIKDEKNNETILKIPSTRVNQAKVVEEVKLKKCGCCRFM